VEVVDRNIGKDKKDYHWGSKIYYRQGYMIQGLKEFLEYIYFVKEKSVEGMYVFDNSQNQIEVEGILFETISILSQ
jgi:hypothetical protein